MADKSKELIDVICISNIVTHEPQHNYHRFLGVLEVGKVYKCYYNYDISQEYRHYLHYIKNGEHSGNYSHYLFITLAEWREKQIDSILEEI